MKKLAWLYGMVVKYSPARKKVISKLIFSSAVTQGASRGHLCDCTAFLFIFVTTNIYPFQLDEVLALQSNGLL